MFETSYQNFIYKRTYSRWVDELMRRENWDESVMRYGRFFSEIVPKDRLADFNSAMESVYKAEVMPSMRALWTAGPALKRDNIAGYNCAYVAINHPKKFAELLYILMNGTGIGFSVERQEVSQLPTIPEPLVSSTTTIVFSDSKRGWAEGYYKLISDLYKGSIPNYDLSKIRPKGAKLKTFGGRASGPEPLEELIKYTINLFKRMQGVQLQSSQCHDMCCMIASAVMVGGVRRSACISLSNLSDDRMAQAKSGDWWLNNGHRQYANNSVAYTEKPDSKKFLREWTKLVESRSGERGVFNRQGARYAVAKTGRRDVNHKWGINPCGEIILRPDEFCNLTEAVLRHGDQLEDCKRKVRHATILGCLQSTLTDFKFIGRSWKNNCEEERLLGVSLTGLADHPVLNNVSKEARSWLQLLKLEAIDTAKVWSEILDIPMPKAITCVKPSGTVSQLVNSSSGLHPRFAPYYIRRVQVSAKDPMAKFLIDKGVPHREAPGEDPVDPNNWAFEFPIKSPGTSVCNDEVTALKQLGYWKMLKDYWCEHNPSCTIYVKDSEWVEVGAWVYRHWDNICGLAFLPVDNMTYVRPPYEEITDDEYNILVDQHPDLDFNELSNFEGEDTTQGSQEYSCSAGECDI